MVRPPNTVLVITPAPFTPTSETGSPSCYHSHPLRALGSRLPLTVIGRGLKLVPSTSMWNNKKDHLVGWLASSLQDLHHGVVLLHRDAGSSALIVLVLGLGIGGNAAIFTLLKAAF